MAVAIKKCRVCGKEYEACHTVRPSDGSFRWQEVACSPACGSIYLARIEESRGIAPVSTDTKNDTKSDTKNDTKADTKNDKYIINVSDKIEYDDEDEYEDEYDDEDEDDEYDEDEYEEDSYDDDLE